MLSIVRACAIIGLDGCIIEVQTDFNPKSSIPTFNIVGLPDSAVKESRERIRAAIRNSSFEFQPHAYVVNLSPADLPKQGPSYDLALAIGVLACTDQVNLERVGDAMFIGELSLDGKVRHVKGVLPMVYTARQAGFKRVFVPEDNAAEAALIPDIEIYPVRSLGQLTEHLYSLDAIKPYERPLHTDEDDAELPQGIPDFADVKGQEHAKRALEIAAAGNHNIIMTGPPGVGKSLLARAMIGIMPPMTLEEALEVTRIYSVAGMLSTDKPLVRVRPFRAPHHTTSRVGLVGGGSVPKPGEISLAHRGILFLDEVVEYGPHTLETLRQPLEDKALTIRRANGAFQFPTNILLVAARNPCPCGYFGDTVKACTCSPNQITRYQSRLSGPMLDRFDIHLDVPRVDYDKLMSHDRAENSADVRERVKRAREIQQQRFKPYSGLYANADMTAAHVDKLCTLQPEAKKVLDLSVRKMQLSARAYHRLLKLCRTIADLSGTEKIEVMHVAEALQYRLTHAAQ